MIKFTNFLIIYPYLDGRSKLHKLYEVANKTDRNKWLFGSKLRLNALANQFIIYARIKKVAKQRKVLSIVFNKTQKSNNYANSLIVLDYFKCHKNCIKRLVNELFKFDVIMR